MAEGVAAHRSLYPLLSMELSPEKTAEAELYFLASFTGKCVQVPEVLLVEWEQQRPALS